MSSPGKPDLKAGHAPAGRNSLIYNMVKQTCRLGNKQLVWPRGWARPEGWVDLARVGSGRVWVWGAMRDGGSAHPSFSFKYTYYLICWSIDYWANVVNSAIQFPGLPSFFSLLWKFFVFSWMLCACYFWTCCHHANHGHGHWLSFYLVSWWYRNMDDINITKP